MANEKGRNKEKRKQKRIDRLLRLAGIEFCACGGGDQLKCENVCREAHTNPKTGIVECGELYTINCSELKRGGSRKPKRGWKFGRQKELNENKESKQGRRQKIARDRSE